MLNFVDTIFRQVGIRQRSLGRRCRMGRATELVFILATGAVLSLGGAAEAQTWDGGGADAAWNTGQNWSPNGVPANGGVVIINGAGGSNANPDVNAATNNVTSTAISGGTVTVGSTLNSGTVSVSGTGTLTINAGGEVRGSSTPTDTALTVSGGTLNNNGTVTGSLSVSSGTASNAGVVTGTTTISGGILNLNAGTNLGDAQALTVNGGTVNVNADETVGELSGTGGTLAFTAGNGLTVDQATDTTFAGAINGATNTQDPYFVKTGAGTLTLSGANTTTGAGNVQILGGTLAVQGGNAIGDNNLVEANSGTLELLDDETIGALGIVSPGAVNLNGNTLTLAGPGFGAEVISNGGVSGSGGITVNGAGLIQTFDSANTYTGDTTITDGTLKLGASDIIDDASDVIINGGTLGMQTFNDTVASVSLQSGSITGSGTLTSAAAFDVRSGSASAVLAGSVGLNKTTGGAATLTGANTYTGTTAISAGSLSVTGTGSLASTTVNVTGTGTLNTDTDALAAGATVSVGTGATFTSSGTDSFTALTQTGGTVNGSGVLTLSGAFQQSGGTTGDTVDINAATFTQSGGATIAAGTTVTSSGAQTLQGGTIAGALDGAGAVTVNTATTTLSGTITSTDVTIQSGGTLSTDGGGLAAGAVLSNSGALALTGGGDETIASMNGGGTTALSTGSVLTLTTGVSAISGVISGDGGLTVQGTSATTLSGNNSYAGDTTLSAGSLTLNGGAAIANSGAVIVNGGTLNVGADETIGSLAGTGGTVALAANDLTFGGNNASPTSYTGGITGSLGSDLEKTGTGTTTLSGTVNTGGTVTVSGGTLALSGTNTISGGITVDGTGRLRLLSNGAAGGAAGQITTTGSVVSYGNGVNSATPIVVNSNTTQLEVLAADSATQSGIISETGGARPIEKIGTGTLTLSAANTYTGTTTVTAGTLNVQNGAAISDTSQVSIASGATFGLLSNETVGFVTGAGTVSLGTSTLTLNGDGDGTAGETFSYAGAITGTGGLTKVGNDRQVLSGASSYDGTTSVNAGVLNIQNGTALGSTTGGTVVAPGAALEVQGGITSAENLSINGTGIANGGVLRNISGTNTLSGTVDLTAASRINSDAGTLTLSGGINGAGQNLTVGGAGNTTISGAITTTTGTVTKDGAGTLTLSGANTYTGDTTITAGTLVASGGSAIANTGSVIVGNGGTFTVSADEIIGNLSSSDTNPATSTAIVNVNTNLSVAGTQDTQFAGNVRGTSILSYQGSGSLTLNGDSDFTGSLQAFGGAASLLSITGTIDAGFVGASGGATISTDGSALTGTPFLANDAGILTFTGSETVGSLTLDGTGSATGTTNLNGAGTILTLTGSNGASGIAGVITGTGTLNVTGSTTTVAAAGDVQTLTTIGTGGTVVNNGTMAAVTNAGSFTANDGSNTGALTNTGTADINASTQVTDVASITNNTGGTVTIDGGAAAGQAVDVAGAIDVNAGTLSTTGFVIANTLTNDATVNAQGTLDVDDGTVAFDITNAATGTFNTTAALAGAGSSFQNNGTLNVVAGDFTGLSTLTNNEVINVTGRTLSATNINNTDRIILTNGQIGGVFNNTGGRILFNGASGLSSGSIVGGVIDGTDGGTDTDTGDTFTIGAGTTLNSAETILNVNTTTQTADQLVVAAGGNITGNQSFRFRELSSALNLNVATVVVTGDTTFDGLSFTVENATGSAPAFGGTVVYALRENGGNLELLQESSAGVGGIAAGVSLTQALIGSVVNRPTSPFASGLAAEEGCSQGGFARGTLGTAKIEGTSSTAASTRNQSVNADYYGVQAGYDFGCNDGRFFGGWDAAFGALVGYNSGSTDQPVLVNVGLNVDAVASTTMTDFDQRYAGLYAVASKNRLTADVQLRFDNTNFQLSEDVNSGFSGLGLTSRPEFDTDTVTFTARLSYQIPLNENGLAFVPTGGFSYSHTSGASFAFDNGDRLVLDSFDSTVGFIGGTIAKQTVNEDGLSGQAFFGSLNYYNDFAGDRSSTFFRGLDGDEISSSNIGGFGEASIGWNYVRILENGVAGAKQLNANVRADVRFGGNVTDSYSLTAQLRLSF